jgi:hypothetical protein
MASRAGLRDLYACQMGKKSDEVFGISNTILPDSYVDRGALDTEIGQQINRKVHLAIRGASKTGKTWLRQRLAPNSIVIQCRLGKSIEDIYKEALGQLDIRLVTNSTKGRELTGTVEAESEFGINLIGKVKAKLNLGTKASSAVSSTHLKQNVEDLKFIAELILESGRRLVIEDFHYLSHDEREHLAFDLKALWDLGVFVIVIGVWSDNNLLLNINTDLSGRVREASVSWSDPDLHQVLRNGANALNIIFNADVAKELVRISYGNVGILQRLTLDVLDRTQIFERQHSLVRVDNIETVRDAALFYAEELNSVYQSFAQNVSKGIRTRRGSTGIYAHAMAVVLTCDDSQLLKGVPLDDIFRIAHEREPRIQKGNLRIALGNIERLQVDDAGRGLVLSFADGKVRVVDHQLLLYRAFTTVEWPWDDIVRQSKEEGEDYEATSTQLLWQDN